MPRSRTLIELGVDRVLTSGQEPTAYEGAELIAELVRAAGDRIIVMPGGGITARNVGRIIRATGAGEVHFAALTPVGSGMRFRRAGVYMGGELRPPEYDRLGHQGAVGGDRHRRARKRPRVTPVRSGR